ncbi:hypothetical protein ACIBHX_03255 [Nonomuraea sp. NPDC050536]|uniref:hypothetical protein n=1 Tax=Nonomuraea sp. NPDC050536 TaxID=3364366 RepID=UPI0037C71396
MASEAQAKVPLGQRVWVNVVGLVFFPLAAVVRLTDLLDDRDTWLDYLITGACLILCVHMTMKCGRIVRDRFRPPPS